MSAEIYGLDAQPFDEDSIIPIEAVALVQCLDGDGDMVIEVRSTAGLTIWERIGMLTMALEIAKANARDCWVGQDSTDGDDEEEDE